LERPQYYIPIITSAGLSFCFQKASGRLIS
jgi:hypothetical protein